MEQPPTADEELRTRIRQQEVVAELVQRSVESNELDQLLREASKAVVETIETEHCGVLELLPAGNEARLRGGAGWRPELVGNTTVPTVGKSLGRYTLRTPEPVVVDDVRTEQRFSAPELLTSNDAVSGLSVGIGPEDDPWGMLWTFTTDRREYPERDVWFVENVANVLATGVENEQVRSEVAEIYSRISDAFFALDDEWRFTHLNEHADELINPSNQSLVGNCIWDKFPRATERKFEREFRRALSEQATVSFEDYYPEPLNAWFEVRVYPSETGLSVYFRDITERKLREVELEETERRFEAIFEDPNILVGLLALDGTVLDVNQTAMEYIDADLDEVTGEPFWQAPWWGEGDEIQADVMEWVERAATGEYVDFEADLTRPDGQRYTLNGVFRPVTDDDGEVVSVIVSDRDVTERREYERQLEESERRYRTLAEHFPNGIVTLFDRNLEHTLAAGRAFDRISMTAEEFEGKPVYEVWDDSSVEPLEPVFRSVLDGEQRSIELGYEGREWVVHGVPVTDERGEVFAGMTMVQDITEQVERETRREELVDELEKSNERLEQFAYAASHDLQEPLRMVSSYLQLLERRYGDELDDDAKEFIDFAVDGADRMREMVDGLLEYSRVDTRGKSFALVDLNGVLADVREDLRMRIDESDATITTESLPQVEGDRRQLRQVFQNLLDNAIEYSGDEPPRIHVSAERERDTWEISVHDEGTGIDPNDAERVFDVFQSLHTSGDHSGMGIGLALCERIVERHGGDIWVDSEPGEESTFTFTLPADGETRE